MLEAQDPLSHINERHQVYPLIDPKREDYQK
jgi:hypothetical protein